MGYNVKIVPWETSVDATILTVPDSPFSALERSQPISVNTSRDFEDAHILIVDYG